MTKPIALSDRTLSLLHNFASINPSIELLEGNHQRTVSDCGSVIARTTIDETIPVHFPIFTLSALLSTFKLTSLKGGEALFTEEKVTIQKGRTKVDYFASDAATIDYPECEIEIEDVDIEFDISQDVLSDFRKATAGLGLTAVEVGCRKGVLYLKAHKPSMDNSTVYEIEVGKVPEGKEQEFEGLYSTVAAEVFKKPLDATYTFQNSEENGFIKLTTPDGLLEYFLGHVEDLDGL